MSEDRCEICGGSRASHFNLAEPHDFKPGRQFKVGDKVQTRDGRKARIICDDAETSPNIAGNGPLVVLVRGLGGAGDDGEEVVRCYPDGYLYDPGHETRWDLVTAPNKRTVWVVQWPETSFRKNDQCFFVSDSPSYHGDIARRDGALACIKVEIEEGRFGDS